MSKKMSFSSSLPGFRLALAGIILAVGVVGLGAFTRLVDAGLGCPDWPGCYGHLLWPDEEHEIIAANQAFPDMPVIDGKAWPEMVHRYFAGSLGLLILGLAIMAVRNRSIENYPFRQSLFMFVLVVWQALFGMWTVTLKLWPQVVTLHLLGGFTTFVLLVVLAQRLSSYRWLSSEEVIGRMATLKPWLIGGLVVVTIQIFLGGWIASNYAAFGCPPKEFPSCFGSYWPEMDFVHGFNIAQHIGPNYLGGLMENEGRTAIHYVHRIGALVTLLYLAFMYLKIWRVGYQPLTRLGSFMMIILVVQILLGISNVMLVLPLSIAVAHNLVGAFLAAAVASIAVQCHRSRNGELQDESVSS